MAYLTQTELEQRFASLQWWTDDAAAGSIDAAIVAEMIGLAEAEIDSAAGQQYQTPLTLGNATTAAIIKERAGTLAGYKLATRRREVDAADALRLDYEDVQEWLDELKAGKVHLADESAIEAPKPGGGIVLAGGEAIVTRDTMDGL